MESMSDAHYFVLPSQGNIYTLTKLCMSNGMNMVLAASLRRKVFSFEYSINADGFLKPVVKEVQFTYIPSGAEIISIDAFTKSKSSDDFVIGITIIKCGGEPNPVTYLHIYSEWEPSSEFNLDSVTQNCLMLELDFIPYQLFHTELFSYLENNSNREVVWLLSGSDHKVHMFREDRANHCYSEVSTLEHFPEFAAPPSVVMWMDIHYVQQNKRRLSAYGCECGYFQLSLVDVGTRDLISSWKARYDSPVSTVRLFLDKPGLRHPDFLDLPDPASEEPPVHLLVSSSLQPAAIYMDVGSRGFDSCFALPRSNQFDAVLCSTIADVDMDGQHELLLGTFGQEILVYKYQPESENCSAAWKLSSQRSFANPIHSIMYMDVTGDGVRELVILTLRGVHVMQHDSKQVQEIIQKRLKSLKQVQSLKEL